MENLVDLLRRRRERKKGLLDGEVGVALRALEAREAMGDVEEGLAVSARELDLGGIDAVGRLQLGESVEGIVIGGIVVRRIGRGGELGREHLGQVAGRARELQHSPPDAQYHPATCAPDLHTLRSGSIRGRQRRRRRRRRRRLLRHDRRSPIPGKIVRTG